MTPSHRCGNIARRGGDEDGWYLCFDERIRHERPHGEDVTRRE
jgi:hypothetical protein